MDRQDPPHPVLGAALSALRLLHDDPRERRVLQEVARLYHEGFPGAPEKVVPLTAVYAAMGREGVSPAFAADFATLGALLHALGLWRLAKGAYLVDPDLAREVAKTPVGRLPVDLLFRLPEPAPLLLLPEGLPAWPELEGFHVHLEWDPGGRPGIGPHLKLRFLAWIRGEKGHRPATLVLDLDAEDLREAVEKTLARSVQGAPGLAAKTLQEASPLLVREYGAVLAQALSLALYLCQEAPDLGGLSPRPPAPLVKVKGGEKRVFPHGVAVGEGPPPRPGEEGEASFRPHGEAGGPPRAPGPLAPLLDGGGKPKGPREGPPRPPVGARRPREPGPAPRGGAHGGGPSRRGPEGEKRPLTSALPYSSSQSWSTPPFIQDSPAQPLEAQPFGLPS